MSTRPQTILVIDEGTTGTRAALVGTDSRIAAQAYSEITQFHPATDRVEQDPEEIWTACIGVARKALQAAAEQGCAAPSALAITNQRATTVLWDRRSGKAVAPAIVWQDTRTAAMADRLRREWGAKVQSRTGWTLAPVYSSLSLAWLLGNDQTLARRALAGELAFGTIDSWLIHRLTGGRSHVISASNAAVTGAYDLLADGWYEAWLAALGLPLSLFPAVVDDSGVLGTVDASCFGLEIPIAAAVADQSAALFGQNCLRIGEAKTTHGTGTFLDLNVGERPVISSRELSSIIGWRRNGRTVYGLEGYAPVTGAAVQWLRDGAELIRDASETDALATSVDDNGGVYFVPALAGLGAPYWDATARGTLIGISPGTRKAHLVRAVLEGIVYSVKDVLDAMTMDTGAPIRAMRADGGAAANAFLLQFQADMLEASVERAANTEATTMGAAYLAGLAVGLWSREADCFAAVEPGSTFQPRMDDDERRRLALHWQRAVERCRGWVEH